MYRVGQNGEMIRRAAEEDTVETEASREAAQATAPATAAALDAADGSGEITEQQVTEENARSSSEDFTTSLRDALAGATGQPAPQAEEEDDDNRLRNALLLGLGAVAVGSYLNNNRQVALSAPDRVVVTRADGSQEVIKDEVALLRQPGSTVQTENFDDGSSRTIVTRQDGSRVVTIRDARTCGFCAAHPGQRRRHDHAAGRRPTPADAAAVDIGAARPGPRPDRQCAPERGSAARGPAARGECRPPLHAVPDSQHPRGAGAGGAGQHRCDHLRYRLCRDPVGSGAATAGLGSCDPGPDRPEPAGDLHDRGSYRHGRSAAANLALSDRRAESWRWR